MSGWSAAHVTINDDDIDPNNPPSGTPVPLITAFNPAGTPVTSESAPVGDYIPIGIWTSGDADSVFIGLSYPSTLIVSGTPNGPDIGGGAYPGGDSGVRGSPYYEVLYARAADPSYDEQYGVEVSGEIQLVWQSGGSSQFTTGAAQTTSVNFKPLQMYNWGTQIAGSTQSGLQNVKVGQLMNLQVKDPSGKGGIVTWTMPGGATVKNYDPTVSPSKLTYLSEFDRLAVALGSSLSQPPLSFAWVTGGTGAAGSPVPSYVETASITGPFGVAESQTMFNVQSPAASASAYIINPAIDWYFSRGGPGLLGLGTFVVGLGKDPAPVGGTLPNQFPAKPRTWLEIYFRTGSGRGLYGWRFCRSPADLLTSHRSRTAMASILSLLPTVRQIRQRSMPPYLLRTAREKRLR